MALAPGTRLGPYEITAQIGVGGMGEVYRARDTRLKRDVALKVLPAHVASDPDARLRFEREARTVAELNHPHICILHDIGSHDGTDYLVMEYLDGETLADKLAKGPLLLDLALQYGIEIADALDRAHRAGIFHRDLKPGNIMLTTAGVKLLDFGLAKTREPAVAEIAGSKLTTRPPNLTAPGTILGTLQYMAPEQLEGREADARTDIFAFGAVVYEMLTGKRAFEGTSQASLIGAIMTCDPTPIATRQPRTPSALDRAVTACLAKDPEDRWQTARDLLRELKWISAEGPRGSDAAARQPQRRWAYGAWLVAAVALITAIASSLFALRRAAPDAPMTRLDVNTPPTTDPMSFALSPDGRQLVFAATSSGVEKLWLRPLDQADAQPLAGTEGASFPFWRPDSRAVGFFADGKLKRLDLGGGGLLVLADAPFPLGGTWNRDNVIVFSPDNASIMRVAANGGTPVAATRLDAPRGSHRLPAFLPDGRRFLFQVLGAPEDLGVHLGALDEADTHRVLPDRVGAVYASGHLLTARQGALVAVPFDVALGVVSGEPFTVAPAVGTQSSLGAFSVSTTGLVAYRAGAARRRQLTWFDRNGTVVGAFGPPEDNIMATPDLTSDGQRVVVGRIVVAQGYSDIWMIDATRGVPTRFTFGPTSDLRSYNFPVWTQDKSRVAYASRTTTTPWDLFDKPANGVQDERRLLASSDSKFPNDWSPDGRILLYANYASTTGSSDLWALPTGVLRNRFPSPRPASMKTRDSFLQTGDGSFFARTSRAVIRSTCSHFRDRLASN
jgi:serine/threonine protein kinase